MDDTHEMTQATQNEGPSITISNLITSAEAAQMLGISQTQVIRACANEKLPSVQIGRNWLIYRSAIDNFRDTYVPKSGAKNIRRKVDNV